MMKIVSMVLGFVGVTPAALGLYAAVFLGGAGVVITIFMTGKNYCESQTDTANLKAELAAVRADIERANLAAAADKATAETLAGEKITAEARINVLQKSVDALPVGDRCLFGDRAGGMRPQSGGNAPVPRPSPRSLFRPRGSSPESRPAR